MDKTSEVSQPTRAASREAKRQGALRRPLGFDVLRIIAAAMVVWGHSELLTWQAGTQLKFGDRDVALGTLGVVVFFATSGYLICASWMRKPDLRSFSIHRAFRIWPGLVVMTLIVVFVVGPIFTTDPSYWTRGETWSFLYRNWLILPYQHALPGVFSSSRVPEANGTLWSLGVEVCCYMMVVVTGILGILTKRRWVLFVLLAVFALLGWQWLANGRVPAGVVVRAFPVTAFVSGMILRAYRVPLRASAAAGCVAVLALAMALELPSSVLCGPLVAYICIWFGHLGLRPLAFVVERGDPSYGCYIYGFPVQQALLQSVDSLRHHLMLYAMTSVIAALGCGYASWHLIECRALERGRRLASRTTASGRA